MNAATSASTAGVGSISAVVRRAASRSSPWRSAVVAAAGPVVIVLAVLLVLRNYAFRGMITTQHGDILEAWLPFFSHLGRSIREGHVPGYDPYSMAGVPFAPDPQTGWMYLPATLLFTLLPAAAAIRWFLVLQPVLAGLGVYAFLRSESANRVAATSGGLVMALMIADSHIALEFPFAGMLAWTSLSLAAAARYVRATMWGARLVWLLLMALAWGQLAAAHLSHGLVTGTLILLAYLVMRLIGAARSSDRGWAPAIVALGMVMVALPLVNAGYLLPRIGYLPHTTLAMGYAKLNVVAGQVSGQPLTAPERSEPLAIGSSWILGLAASPGAYLGASALALSFAGLWSRRFRGLTILLVGIAGVFFVASLHGLATRLAPHIENVPFVDFYTHAPVRFRYGVLAVLPILVGIGVHAWIQERGWRRHVAMVLPGVAVWWALGAIVGRPNAFPVLFLVGTLAAVAALALTAWRRSLAWLIPAVLLVELTVNGVLGARLPRQDTGSPWGPNLTPLVHAADYLREGSLARAIADGGEGRYVTLTSKGQAKPGRKALLEEPKAWAALGDQRSILFQIPDAGGYNPTQLVRYWEFVRAVDHQRLPYNAAFLIRPVPPAALDLLQIRWLIASTGSGPADPTARLVTREGAWGLYEVASPAPRASVLSAWSVVASAGAARRTVTAAGFDPSVRAVLERDPGIRPAIPSGGGGTTPRAVYRDEGPGSGTVLVDTDVPAIVLIRNPYGPGWHATVDGAPAPIMPADFVDQGVAVQAGHHVLRLRYDDPSIGVGAAATAGSVFVILLAAGLFAVRERRRDRRSTQAAFAGVERFEP